MKRFDRSPYLRCLVAVSLGLQACASDGAGQESNSTAGNGSNSVGGSTTTGTVSRGGNATSSGGSTTSSGATSSGASSVGSTTSRGGTGNDATGGAATRGGASNGVTGGASNGVTGGAATRGGASNTAAGAGSSTSNGGTGGTTTAVAGGGSTASTGATLKVSGNDILDTCGNPLVIRGVEQLFNHAIQVNGSFQPIVDGIIASGSNAVRMLPSPGDITAADLDSLIASFANAQVVVYLSPGDRTWFNRAEIKTVLNKHAAWIILDAYQEPDFDDRARWKTEAIAALKAVRSYGYTVPLTALANQYGRDLPSLIQSGSEVVAADTAKNTILGWQAYWGVSGWYQNDAYHMTLTEGVVAAASQSFPIQIGIDQYADPSDIMDYQSVMNAAQTNAVGWLWWNWWNPFGSNANNLSVDGTITNLMDVGNTVVSTHANSIKKTSRKACRTN